MSTNKENRSLNQLMGITSLESTTEHSYLIDRCMQLSNVPISEFEVEDYRLLINQGIGLEYLVAGAIDILSSNLFAEGDYYEGDLLKAILTINESFWKENPILMDKLKQAILRQFKAIETLDLSDPIKESLHALVKGFMELK